MRNNGRLANQLRPIKLTRHFTRYAEGSVLVEFGNTKVLCNASVENTVPRFLRGQNQGWLTSQYSMLPRSTHTRSDREATRGKQSGRTMEIQRLIGRTLRSAIDLTLLGEYTITLDCDVLQADGGTRTASITGACVALVDALRFMQRKKLITSDPFTHFVGSVSVGIIDGEVRLDLDYDEDSNAQTDMNVVMNDEGGLIEIQGTAERETFSHSELADMLGLATQGIETIIAAQRDVLKTV